MAEDTTDPVAALERKLDELVPKAIDTLEEGLSAPRRSDRKRAARVILSLDFDDLRKKGVVSDDRAAHLRARAKKMLEQG